MNQAAPPAPSSAPAKPHHSWPTAISVIGILLAVLGLSSGILFFIISPDFLANILPEKQRADFEKMVSRTNWNVVLQVIGILLDLLLLWGSIVLLKRRFSCRGLLNTWAILTIIFTIVFMSHFVIARDQLTASDAVETRDRITEQAEAKQEGASAQDVIQSEREEDRELSKLTLNDSIQHISGIVSGICTGLLSLVWPVIVLCFMNTSRKRELIASWQP